MEQGRHQHNDEDRCRELQYDGICRRGELIGNGKESGHTDGGEGADEYGAVQPDCVPCHQEKDSNDGGANQVPCSVDGQRRPGNQLDAQPANAEKHRGEKHTDGPGDFSISGWAA